MYDAVIIGAGPAGISASLYIGRANLKTLILYYEEAAVEKTNKIQNYYGFEEGISGKELYQKGIKQAENIGVEVKKEEVTNIQRMPNGFVVKTEQNAYQGKSVILAMGNKKKKPSIENLEEFEGKGVSYCAVCDGFFYRNKNISVIGNGNYAISEVNELIHLAKEITILTNGGKTPQIRSDGDNLKVDTKEIKAIQGEKKVEAIQFKDGTTLKTEGVFIANGVAGSLDFAKKLGIMTRTRQYTS